MMLTVLEIIKRTTDFLAGRGIDNSRLNAELLIGHGLGLKRMQLYLQFERLLTETELEAVRQLVRRRGLHEPLQYVTGETEFHGLKLKTDKRALIPRPETERLTEMVISRCTVPPRRILDLGTGSGAIALALAAAFREAEVTAVDASPAALALAAENAAHCGLEGRVSWMEARWYEALAAGTEFGLIVANPPYLTAKEAAQAPVEVRDFEPREALVSGGDDGLDDLRAIVAGAPRFLAAGGLLAVETGVEQHAALLPLAVGAGLVGVESARDLAGRDRFVFARK